MTEVPGDARLAEIDGTEILVGHVFDGDRVLPVLAELVDGDAVPVEIETGTDDGATRLRSVAATGPLAPAVIGHRYVDDELRFFGLRRTDGGWEPIEPSEAFAADRGATGTCGPTAAFVSGTGDGPNTIEHLSADPMTATTVPDDLDEQVWWTCSDAIGDGTVLLAGDEDIVRASPELEEVEVVYSTESGRFTGADVVGGWVVAPLVRPGGTELEVLVAPADDLDDWTSVDVLPIPPGTEGPFLRGRDGETLIMELRRGWVPEVWRLTIDG